MKKLCLITAMLFCSMFATVPKASAQIAIAEIIKKAVVKVIKAIDLKIQRQQNKVIWLQNAQKKLENTMSELKLKEISDWAAKQKKLYKDYFDELARVKAIISYYHRIQEITQKQVRLVDEYKRAWGLLKQDTHFTPEEFDYMAKVYSGLLEESGRYLDELLLVIHSFTTQMSDASRIEIINRVADGMDKCYNNLQQFNRMNARISVSRARSMEDIAKTRALYGL